MDIFPADISPHSVHIALATDPVINESAIAMKMICRNKKAILLNWMEIYRLSIADLHCLTRLRLRFLLPEHEKFDHGAGILSCKQEKFYSLV